MAMVKTIFWPGVVNHHPRLRAFLPAAEHRVHLSGCAKGNFHVPNAGGIRIGFDEMVAKMPFLEQAYTKFLDCLPTIKGPLFVTKTAATAAASLLLTASSYFLAIGSNCSIICGSTVSFILFWGLGCFTATDLLRDFSGRQ